MFLRVINIYIPSSLLVSQSIRSGYTPPMKARNLHVRTVFLTSLYVCLHFCLFMYG
jgi:hypothetical protein